MEPLAQSDHDLLVRLDAKLTLIHQTVSDLVNSVRGKADEADVKDIASGALRDHKELEARVVKVETRLNYMIGAAFIVQIFIQSGMVVLIKLWQH